MGLLLTQNYKSKTKFWSDFTIADEFGVGGVRTTFSITFSRCKDNAEQVMELALVLYLKSEEHIQYENFELYQTYDNLFYQVNNYCMENLDDDDLSFYLKMGGSKMIG